TARTSAEDPIIVYGCAPDHDSAIFLKSLDDIASGLPVLHHPRSAAARNKGNSAGSNNLLPRTCLGDAAGGKRNRNGSSGTTIKKSFTFPAVPTKKTGEVCCIDC